MLYLLKRKQKAPQFYHKYIQEQDSMFANFEDLFLLDSQRMEYCTFLFILEFQGNRTMINFKNIEFFSSVPINFALHMCCFGSILAEKATKGQSPALSTEKETGKKFMKKDKGQFH